MRGRATFTIETPQRPDRVTVDPYGLTAKANGGAFSVHSFNHDLSKTLIVYGTADELATNQEAAEALQRGIIESGSNVTVPVRSDQKVTEEELKIASPSVDRPARHEPVRGAIPRRFPHSIRMAIVRRQE